MRITGGKLRGHRLPLQKGGSVRPTSDRVREALFSILGQDLTDCKVLDVYGGSGVLAIEAVSRGAVRATVFDRDPKAVRQCMALVEKLRLRTQIRVRKGTVPKCLPTGSRFDLIFVDPPYTLDPLKVLEVLAPMCAGVLVLEHRDEAPEPKGLMRVDSRQYGDTTLSFYRETAALQST